MDNWLSFRFKKLEAADVYLQNIKRRPCDKKADHLLSQQEKLICVKSEKAAPGYSTLTSSATLPFSKTLLLLQWFYWAASRLGGHQSYVWGAGATPSPHLAMFLAQTK